MQLFVTPYTQEGNTIIIHEERVVSQLSKVLRAKKGDQVAFQRPNSKLKAENSTPSHPIRVICAILEITKHSITAAVLTSEEREIENSGIYLAVAMPNKFEKLELIVQKCTEIGIDHLIFFPAKHSVVKEISETKMERLKKISLEAVEQSRGRNKIDMTFSKNILSMCEGKKIFIAHQHGKIIQHLEFKIQNKEGVIVLVGPEGGRHADEEKIFEEMKAEKISLGENILRTETAAIISGRMMKNFL